MGFGNLEISLTQLSHVAHGASTYSQFGLKFVAPLYQRVENQFLSERAVIPLDGSLGYLKVLKSRLAQNGCVWIRGDQKSKRQNVETEFFNVRRKFATGAPGLAWRHRAALFPSHVVREGPFHYRVIIHQPVEPDSSCSKREFVQSSVGRYAASLQDCILKSPADYDWGDPFLRV